MRGTVAKRIRKIVYGEDLSPKFREYQDDFKTNVIKADLKRHEYQQVKAAYTKHQID